MGSQRRHDYIYGETAMWTYALNITIGQEPRSRLIQDTDSDSPLTFGILHNKSDLSLAFRDNHVPRV